MHITYIQARRTHCLWFIPFELIETKKSSHLNPLSHGRRRSRSRGISKLGIHTNMGGSSGLHCYCGHLSFCRKNPPLCWQGLYFTLHPHASLLVVLAIVFFDFAACPLCSDSLILLFFPSPVSAQEKPETSVSGLAQDQRRCQVHLLIKLLMNKVI